MKKKKEDKKKKSDWGRRKELKSEIGRKAKPSKSKKAKFGKTMFPWGQ